jgi:hypothetical protein
VISTRLRFEIMIPYLIILIVIIGVVKINV